MISHLHIWEKRMRHLIWAFRPPVVTQCEHAWITTPAGWDHEKLDLTIRLDENTANIPTSKHFARNPSDDSL